MKFSQRKGFAPAPKAIPRDSMTVELRNSLWNVLDAVIWRKHGFLWGHLESGIAQFSFALWFQFYKEPADTRPDGDGELLQAIRKRFFASQWFEVYDFLEWVLVHENNRHLERAVNAVLEIELAGLRFVDKQFTDITDEAEIAVLEEALADNDFPGVRAHLRAALEHLSNRKSPDYRNSIKESISAVESMAQVVSGEQGATLGDALKIIEKRNQLHGALKAGFSKLYGYTSDEGGIRHAMLEEPNLGPAEAKYFLLSCTSFINYLKSKL